MTATTSATAETQPQPSTTATTAETKTYQLSLPLPHALYTRLRLHLSVFQSAIMLFLTTTTDLGGPGMNVGGMTETGAGTESQSKLGEGNGKLGQHGAKDEEEGEGKLRRESSTAPAIPPTTTSETTRNTASPLAPMGSFVYAMPDLSTLPPGSASASSTSVPRQQQQSRKQPLVTPLYPHPPSTLDFATRCARILAHRLRRPVYVGSSVSEMDLGLNMDAGMMMTMTANAKMGAGGGANSVGGTGKKGTVGSTRHGGNETGVLGSVVDVVAGIVNGNGNKNSN